MTAKPAASTPAADSTPSSDRQHILVLLTYYWPHISGLTLYAKRIAEGLAARGHAVRVLTSRFRPGLPAREVVGGVEVERSKVLARVSKGAISPQYLWRACAASHQARAVNIHLPQAEAALLVLYARFVARRPVFVTYHCDLELPPGPAKAVFTPFIKASHLLAVLFATKVVAISDDYARGSRFLRHFRSRMAFCYPPSPRLESGGAAPPLDLPPEAKLIGFVGRFAAEKGVEYILAAAPRVLEAFPEAVFAFVGEREAVIGERVYGRLEAQLQAFGDRVRPLGVLPEQELAAFYERCDVLLLPSVNSTESFGMVQVEAMFAGVPVVASDIPGVRVPVSLTGMGELVPPRDPEALAAAIVRVLGAPERYQSPRVDLERTFGVARAVDFYEALFEAGGAAPAPRSRTEEAAPR